MLVCVMNEVKPECHGMNDHRGVMLMRYPQWDAYNQSLGVEHCSAVMDRYLLALNAI